MGTRALPSIPLLVEGEEEEDDEEEDDLDEEVIDDEEDDDDDLEGEEEEDGVDDEVRLPLVQHQGHMFVPCLVTQMSQEPLWGRSEEFAIHSDSCPALWTPESQELQRIFQFSLGLALPMALSDGSMQPHPWGCEQLLEHQQLLLPP